MSTSMFWSELLSCYLNFVGILTLVLTVVTGFAVGMARFHWVGLIIVTGIVLVGQWYLMMFNPYVESLVQIYRTGSVPGIASVINTHDYSLRILLFICIGIGVLGKKGLEFDARTKADAMTTNDITKMLAVLAGHPDLASGGWFQSRWSAMDADQRSAWVRTHLADLKELWIKGEVADANGFEAFGTNLPMELAAIDRDIT